MCGNCSRRLQEWCDLPVKILDVHCQEADIEKSTRAEFIALKNASWLVSDGSVSRATSSEFRKEMSASEHLRTLL